MMKKGFTYLELVIVIVLIGILALLSLERMKRDNLYEAANQVLSHIRYAQHLAMIDDRFDPKNENWITQQYRIQFHNNTSTKAYTVYRHLGNTDQLVSGDIIIKDPLSGKDICGLVTNPACDEDIQFKKANLTKAYNIKQIRVTGGNGNNMRQIMFDYMGRPMMKANASPSFTYTNNNINIELCLTNDCDDAGSDEKVTIAVDSETGYARFI